MNYSTILSWLANFNLIAWLIATICALIILSQTKNKGWILVAIGSIFVVLRQVWKLFPDYKLDQLSDQAMNAYMVRYVFGATGALFLCIGFVAIIISYYVLKSKLEENSND